MHEFQQVIPALGCITDTKFLAGCGVKAASTHELLGFHCSRGVEVALKKFGGDFMGIEQTLTFTHLLAVGPAPLLIVQFIVDASS